MAYATVCVLGFRCCAIIFRGTNVNRGVVKPVCSAFVVVGTLKVLICRGGGFLILGGLLLVMTPFDFMVLVDCGIPLILLTVFVRRVDFSCCGYSLSVFVVGDVSSLAADSCCRSVVDFIGVVCQVVVALVVATSFRGLSFGTGCVNFAVVLFVTCVVSRILREELGGKR